MDAEKRKAIHDDMLRWLQTYQEERLVIDEKTIIVRELRTDDDTAGLSKDPDAAYKLMVLCTFDEEGNRIFTNADIPALKASRRGPVMEIMNAVDRVLAPLVKVGE